MDTGTEFAEVRKALAANVAWNILFPDGSPPEEDGHITQQMFTMRMLKHLNSARPWKPSLRWAVKVYATYL